MSYTYLQATGEESSVESFPATLQFAQWKSIHDAGKYYFNGKETESCLGFQSGTTFEHSMELHGEDQFKSSVEVSHAPILVQLELIPNSTGSNSGLMDLVLDCGEKWRELLEKFNLELCVLKTPQIYALKDLSECSKILTQWGMMRNGECFNVATSARTISEKGFLSLLPTPTSHNSKEGAYPAEGTRNTPTLAFQIGGKINPDWNEWRMGCPTRWSDLNPLEIDKFLEWLRLHGKY